MKDRFIKEVVDRYVELKHGGTITAERRYVIGELKKIYDETESEDTKSQVELFEKIYRNITRPAVLSELRKLKRNRVEGRALLDRLTEIWYRHSLHEVSSESMDGEVVPPVPKIICGELL